MDQLACADFNYDGKKCSPRSETVLEIVESLFLKNPKRRILID